MQPPLTSAMPCESCERHRRGSGCTAQADRTLVLTRRWHAIRPTLAPALCIGFEQRVGAPPAWTWHIAAHA